MTTFKAFLAEAQQTLVERTRNGRAWEDSKDLLTMYEKADEVI